MRKFIVLALMVGLLATLSGCYLGVGFHDDYDRTVRGPEERRYEGGSDRDQRYSDHYDHDSRYDRRDDSDHRDLDSDDDD